jgi:hypothetical protein
VAPPEDVTPPEHVTPPEDTVVQGGSIMSMHRDQLPSAIARDLRNGR